MPRKSKAHVFEKKQAETFPTSTRSLGLGADLAFLVNIEIGQGFFIRIPSKGIAFRNLFKQIPPWSSLTNPVREPPVSPMRRPSSILDISIGRIDHDELLG